MTRATGRIDLETDRLILRQLTFGNLDDIAALCADADFMRFFVRSIYARAGPPGHRGHHRELRRDAR